MSEFLIDTTTAVKQVFQKYPKNVRKKLDNLRALIIETAQETEGINSINEALKWGEPSYQSTYGSTIRIDWKPKTPDQYAMYFVCTSSLIPAFKLMYNDVFAFDSNRALVFQMDEVISKKELKNCIKAALCYHKVKHLPGLGM